jgi:protein TonB
MLQKSIRLLFEYRLFVSWLLTTILYGATTYLLFTHTLTKPISQTKQPKNATINLSFSTFVPPTPPQKPIEKPKPLPEPPKPIEKPKVEPKPKPKTKKTIPIKPKEKKKVQKKPQPKKIVKKKRKPPSKKQQLQTTANFNAFMATVRKRIDQNKSYPTIAKRRGLQGKVTASFKVLANGKVSNITLKGSKLFYRSAREAIQKAFPINPQTFKVTLPKKATITLNYRLR